MSDPARKLKELKPEKEFFIGIDSDGCVFDTMETKHKECFCPQFVNHFGLQPVSRYARDAWEFVNLYSKTRGVNRFRALTRALDLLSERREVKHRKAVVPQLEGVKSWVARESKLGNPTLKLEVERNPDPDLKRTYAWSLEVNEVVKRIVHHIPPFPLFRESLLKMFDKADTIVVSQTPNEALEREWQEHSIDQYVRIIAGQEMGTKTEHLSFAAKGKYPAHKILMIGDAPGDFKAAKTNDALFFPINPGDEEASWELFYNEALDRFFAGTFAGEYEAKLIEEFNRHLPEKAPWQD